MRSRMFTMFTVAMKLGVVNFITFVTLNLRSNPISGRWHNQGSVGQENLSGGRLGRNSVLYGDCHRNLARLSP